MRTTSAGEVALNVVLPKSTYKPMPLAQKMRIVTRVEGRLTKCIIIPEIPETPKLAANEVIHLSAAWESMVLNGYVTNQVKNTPHGAVAVMGKL